MRLAPTIAFLLPLSLVAASKVGRESLDAGGQRHEYFVFVPKTVEGRPGAPLLVLLHGSGHDGLSQIDPWKDVASREGIILVAPSAINPRMWQLPLDGPEPLIAIAEAVRNQYQADANRIYLFGHSAGAVFSLYMACEKPNYFAAISVHAGAVPDDARDEVAGVLSGIERKTPIQVQVGADDPFFPVAAVRRTQALFVEAGVPFEVKVIPRHDHNYYAISAEVNREAWAFLRDKTLAPPAK
jgi:poly(3-hydroxybutyrate) depolymerase